MVQFSIIIPHHNIPELLTRCLNSIPCREDVQIIIVDDNSDPSKVDFSRFPGLDRAHTEVYFDKTGLGAGHARNVGLDHAKGKWLIFSDADDFFSVNFSRLIEQYRDASQDLIYFNVKAVMSEDITKESNRSSYTEISQYQKDLQPGHEIVRCIHVVPWAKMIKRQLVVNHGIRFQETRWSNDVYFAMNIGVLAKDVALENEVLYYVTERPGSLMSQKKKSSAELRCRVKVCIESYKIALAHGYKEAFGACNGWIVDVFNQGKILIFLQAIRKLGNPEAKVIHGQLARNQNLFFKIYLKILFLSARILPLPKL